MVNLEPAHTPLGVAEGPAVVAGRPEDDLADAPADGPDHHPVEKPGAGVEVVAHPPRGLLARRDVGGQRLVRGGIAVASRHPGEAEAVRRHPAGRNRRAAISQARPLRQIGPLRHQPILARRQEEWPRLDRCRPAPGAGRRPAEDGRWAAVPVRAGTSGR